MSNVKEMYETLVAIRESHKKCETGHDVLVVRTIDKALAEPPRNCDVGTPDEQSRRFEDFCLEHIGCAEDTGGRHCVGCPLEKASKKATQKCELYWAQMPYEAREGGDK